MREHVEQDEENETEIVRESLITSNNNSHILDVPPPNSADNSNVHPDAFMIQLSQAKLPSFAE